MCCAASLIPSRTPKPRKFWASRPPTASLSKTLQPAPARSTNAGKIMGFAPPHWMVVEDAPAGIRAGKAAGARVLALRTTAPDPELTQSGADWIANDLASLRFLSSDHRPTLEFVLTQ